MRTKVLHADNRSTHPPHYPEWPRRSGHSSFWESGDRLADDRDAYVISAVRAYAARDARMDRRHTNAASLRYWATQADLTEVVSELEQLACDLENADLDLSPACAIVCRRLLTDPTVSPLLNGGLADDLHETIVEIERGFSTVPTTS